MYMIDKISNRTLSIVLFSLSLLCVLWYLFFSEFYRITYTFLSFIAIFLLCLVLKNRRQVSFFIKDSFTAKTINILINVVMLFAVIIALNYIANKNEYRIDITRNRINTLSEQTIKVLGNLKDKIHYIAFINQASQGAYFRNIMAKYRYYSNKISYEIIDPNKEPLKARAYNITNYGTVIAVKGKEESRAEFITEEALSNAIIKLTRTDKKQIYFLSGHLERDLYSDDPDSYSIVRDHIASQGYNVDKLNISKTGEIPKDTNLLIIAGAKRKFFDAEVKLITSYIKKGGAVLVLSDPSLPEEKLGPSDNVNRVLSKFGIMMNNDIIVDPSARMFGLTDAMPVVQNYDRNSVISSDFKEPTIYPFAQSIDSSKVDIKKYNVYNFCKTSPSSWGELDSRKGNISFDKGKDRKGPLNICVNLIEEKENGINIVAFGNSSFASNKYVSHAANIDIFMNSVSFLLNDKDLLAIRPRVDESGKVVLSSNPIFALMSVYIIPFTLLIFGTVYWYRRRRR